MTSTHSFRSAGLITLAIFVTSTGLALADDRSDLQALVTKSKGIVQKIRTARADDPRLYFLETQSGILDGMLASPHFKTNPQDLNWLKRVTQRFMTSLNQALDGRIAKKAASTAENDTQWQKVFAGEVGGFWWGAAFADCEKLARTFVSRPWPAPQLDEWYATTFMVAHIDFDLRLSLLTEGVGSDAAFVEVGRLVQAAWDAKSRHPRSLIEFGTQFDPVLRALDPMRRRTVMREQVKAYHRTKGITDPWKGLQFQGTPEAAAFGGAMPP